MSDEDASDKTYDPTPNKLEEARRKGEVPKSTDLNVAMGYLGLVLALFVIGPGLISDLGVTLSGLLADADRVSDKMLSGKDGATMGSLVLAVLLPFVFLLAPSFTLVLLSLVVQRALLFTPSKLAMRLSRISVLSNAKQKFGRSGLFEFAKSATKLLIFAAILGMFLARNADRILISAYGTPGQISANLGDLILRLCGIVLVVAFAIGLVDLIWQRAEHIRKNRMSRKEVTDELKSNEGDPELKQKRRQKGQQIALTQMLADVPDAAVVIVNPTHYAVALKWDRLGTAPPICVAKGVDEIAARIREVAAEAGVPIHSDPPTARSLHAGIEIGEPIDVEHYMAVAAAIRFADDLRQKARHR